MARGKFKFELTPGRQLSNVGSNVESLRKLWLDRTLVDDETIGPGDPGDFDNGAWHSACHLAGAGGVMRTAAGLLTWLEISHDPRRDDYYASITVEERGSAVVFRLDSAEGRSLVEGARLLGYVEGNSTGRTSARNSNDPTGPFVMWRRQDFDMPSTWEADGGKVWEHWVTVRDIRPASAIGSSVLTAYIALVSVLGERFPATVVRGRTEYGHPEQLLGMIKGGLVTASAATWDVKPTALLPAAEALFNESEPAKALQACSLLDWSNPPRYYMFARKIDKWNSAKAVKAMLKEALKKKK